MKCPQCGTENNNDSIFCANCGSLLPGNDLYNKMNNVERPVYTPPSPKREPTRVGRAVSALLHALLYVTIFFGAQLFVESMYSSAFLVSRGILEIDEETYDLLVKKLLSNSVLILLLSNLITLLAVGLIQTLRKKSVKREIGLNGVNWMRYPTFALFGVALNFFVTAVINILPLPAELLGSLDSQYSSLFEGGNIYLQLLSVSVVTGIVEEVIFRSLMITRLRKGFGKITALIISAVVFGLVHGTPIAICYATFLGILFGVMYLVYDSIVPSVLCHIFFNMTSYFIAGFNVPIEYILVVSAVLVLFFGYRILIRRPTFSDILSDRGGRIKGRTEEENRIFDEIRALTKREDVTAYDVDNLSEEFDRVMKKRREPKFNRKR